MTSSYIYSLVKGDERVSWASNVQKQISSFCES